MSIELQLNDEKEYERLKEYAIYSSDRTKVIELPDKYSYLVDNKVGIEAIDNKAYLDYENKKWIFTNLSDDIRYYIGDMYGGKSEYKFEIITYLPELIRQGIVVPSGSVLGVFNKINKLTTISDLECSKKKYKVNGKWQNMDNISDEEVIYLFSEKVTKHKEIFTTDAEVINSIFSRDTKGKDYLDLAIQVTFNGFPTTVSSRIYYMSRITSDRSPIKTLTKEGNKLNALIERKISKDGGETLDIVGIAPHNFIQKRESIVSPTKEVKKELGKLPVTLYRIINAEYELRELIKGMNNDRS